MNVRVGAISAGAIIVLIAGCMPSSTQRYVAPPVYPPPIDCRDARFAQSDFCQHRIAPPETPLRQPLSQSSAESMQTPVVASTPVPNILNSPDTYCSYKAQCTDAEFNEVVNSLHRQWVLMPEWMKSKCTGLHTWPTVEGCILNQTVAWLNTNPKGAAPWLTSTNWLDGKPMPAN